ncbi:hypothetical protein IV102_06270 [bacterium]|nr:hypothetical protein [bacterium]
MNCPSETAQAQTVPRLLAQLAPLAMSDVIMALGDPLQISAVSRLSNPKESLAAMGIVKALANFLESPIIMVLHASTALSGDRSSRRCLARFVLWLALVCSGLFLLLSLPGFYEWVFLDLFGTTPQVAQAARRAMLWMVLWPAFIAWRRFFQGVMIRDKQGRWLGWASIARLTTFATLLWIGFWQRGQGPEVAAIALMGGLLAEALCAQYFAYRSGAVASFASQNDTKLPQSLPQMWRYYLPLASTMVIVWGGRAMLVAVLARAVDGPLALASWPAAWNFLLLVANCTRMVQQMIIAQARQVCFQTLLRFAACAGLAASGLMIVLAFSGAGESALLGLLGNQQDLYVTALPVLRIGCWLPLLVAAQNACQGFCIVAGKNWRIQQATVASLLTTLVVTFSLTEAGYSGTVCAIWGMMLGLLFEVGVLATGALAWPSKRIG